MTSLESLIGRDKLSVLERFDYSVLPREIVNNIYKSEIRKQIYDLFHEWGYFAECLQLMSAYPEDRDDFVEYLNIARTLSQMFLRDRLLLSNNSQNILCGRYTYSVVGSPEFCFLPQKNVYSCESMPAIYGANIGKFTGIAPGVKIICGGNHQLNSLSSYPFWHTIFETCGWEFPVSDRQLSHPFREWGLSKGIVTIGNDVWIGQDAFILSGTVIPNGCVIGARSVVSGSLEPYGIYVGNPARLLRFRLPPFIIAKIQEISWWDLRLSEIRDIAPYLCSLNSTSINRS